MIEDHAMQGLPGEASVVPTPPRQRPVGNTENAAKPRHRAQGRDSNWVFGEPAIGDLLEDPLIHAILRRDGLGLEDLAQAISVGRRRLSSSLHSRAA